MTRRPGTGARPPYFSWLTPATLLVPLSMLLLVGWVQYGQAMREAEADLRRSAAVLHQHAQKVFETQGLLLDKLAAEVQRRLAGGQDWGDIAAAEELHRQMAAMAADYEQVTGLGVIDPQGFARLSSYLYPLPPVDVTGREYWHSPFMGAGLIVSAPFVSRTLGETLFLLAHRLESPTGEFQGLVASTAQPVYFQQVWRGLIHHEGSAVALLRRDGTVLAHWPHDPGPSGGPTPPLPGQPLPAGGTGVVRDLTGPDGARHVVARQALDGFPVLVQVSRTRNAILDDWAGSMAGYAAIAVAGGLLLLALALRAHAMAGRERQALLDLRAAVQRRADSERALRASEARYRGYFDNTAELLAIYVAGPDGYHLEEANPTLSRGLGIERSALVGANLDVLLPEPGSRRKIEDRLEECRQAGRPLQFTDTVTVPTGTRTYETTLVPLPEPDGQILRLLASARDVTEQREQDQRLVQAQKMETVGLLTGGVAHDFNNLLTAITNNLELVRTRPGDDANDSRVGSAIRAARAGADLVRRLMSFARQQPLEPRAVDLARVVQDAMPLLQRAVGERISFASDLPAGIPPVLVDPVQVENALLNLAVNARDAMPDGGRIGIRLRSDPPSGNTPGMVTLAVADTGHGMTPEVAARIFEPFFTTKGPGRGTGLGLSTVYGFVRQSGGQMRVETAPGRGAVFHMTFPATDLPAPAPAPADTPAHPCRPARVGRTVLLVEDEALVRQSTLDLLRDMGFHTLEAPTAEAALALLEQGAAVDLLVTDIGLPGMDGRTMAQRAVAMRPGLPVVLTTGYDRSGGDPEAVARGPWLHLEKPYTPQRLVAVLDRALADPGRREERSRA